MNSRINYERVRKIKSVIYTFIILLFLVPAVLLIVLGVQMVAYIGPMRTIIAQHESAQAATPAPAPEAPAAPPAPEIQPGGTEVLEPEDLFPVPPALEADNLAEPGETTEPELLGQITTLPAPTLEGEDENSEIAGQTAATPPAQDSPAPATGTATGRPVDVGIPHTGLPRE